MHAGPIALFNEVVRLVHNGDRVERWRQDVKEMERRPVQCADCLTWIDRDKPHTCRPQVRRNQKRAIRRDDTPREGEQRR